jgi:hypothetical protein
VTLPLIHAYAMDSEGTRALVEGLLADGSAAGEDALRDKLEELGSLRYAFGEARRLVATARDVALRLDSGAEHPAALQLEELEARVLAAAMQVDRAKH